MLAGWLTLCLLWFSLRINTPSSIFLAIRKRAHGYSCLPSINIPSCPQIQVQTSSLAWHYITLQSSTCRNNHCYNNDTHQWSIICSCTDVQSISDLQSRILSMYLTAVSQKFSAVLLFLSQNLQLTKPLIHAFMYMYSGLLCSLMFLVFLFTATFMRVLCRLYHEVIYGIHMQTYTNTHTCMHAHTHTYICTQRKT